MLTLLLFSATCFKPGETIEVRDHPALSVSLSTGDNGTTAVKTVYVLEHSHSDTYYHFLIEALPRLEHMWTTVSTDESIQIFQTSPFAPSAFAMLGLGPDRSCGDHRTVYPRVLLPPPMTDPRNEATIARLKSMAARLVAAAGLAETGAEKKPTWLVINREGARARRILNHEELMDGLRESFPEVVFREFGGPNSWQPGFGRRRGLLDTGGIDKDGLHVRRRLDAGGEGGIENSLRSFRSCWGVIAPHGAGLSNIVFIGKKNASVVEIVGEGQTGKVYKDLAEQFGHQHMYITAPHVSWQHVHMEVDVPAVLEAVAPIFGEVLPVQR